MIFSTRVAFVAFTAALVAATPAPSGINEIDGKTIAKRDTSYGNPHEVTDMGDRFRLNYETTEGHEHACPGHYICYILKRGRPKSDVSLGNPDLMVDEGRRWRLNYGSTSGHPNACDGHYICYIYKQT